MKSSARNKYYALALMLLLLLCAGKLYLVKYHPSTPMAFGNDTSYARNHRNELEQKALAGDRHAADSLVDYSIFGLKSEKQTVKWLEVAVKNGDDMHSLDTPGYARYSLAMIYIGKGISAYLGDKYPATPESCARGLELLQQIKGEKVIYAELAAKELSRVPPDCGLKRE
jgi:hypothetical protein